MLQIFRNRKSRKKQKIIPCSASYINKDLAGPRRKIPIKIPVLQGEASFWLQHMPIYLYLARD